MKKSGQDLASLCPRSQDTGDFCEKGCSLETWKLSLTLRQPRGVLSWATAAGSQGSSERPLSCWPCLQVNKCAWQDCQGLCGSEQASLPKQEGNPAQWKAVVVKFPTEWTAQTLPGVPSHEVEHRQAEGDRCGCALDDWALATEVQCVPSQDAQSGALKTPTARTVLGP